MQDLVIAYDGCIGIMAFLVGILQMKVFLGYQGICVVYGDEGFAWCLN